MVEGSETFLNPTRRVYNYEGSKSSGNKFRIILIILGIIILVGLIIFAALATGGKGEQETVITPTVVPPTNTPTPTIELSPSPTESLTPTKKPKTSPTPEKGTPTPTGTSTKDKTTGLDRADLKIEVQNGSGTAGVATKASNLLKKLGYDVVSSGNADNFEYAGTTIQVKSTKKSYLDMLKKDLADTYTITSATSDYKGTEADAVVIIGK